MTLMGCHYFTVLSFKKSPSGIHKYRQRRVDFDIYKCNWRVSSVQVESEASLAKPSFPRWVSTIPSIDASAQTPTVRDWVSKWYLFYMMDYYFQRCLPKFKYWEDRSETKEWHKLHTGPNLYHLTKLSRPAGEWLPFLAPIPSPSL